MSRRMRAFYAIKLPCSDKRYKDTSTFPLPASNSNIDILQRFQNKVLRSITNAPWYVPNTILHTDLQIPTVKAEITNYSTKYSDKLLIHPNEHVPALLEEDEPRRLKRFKPAELATRFS